MSGTGEMSGANEADGVIQSGPIRAMVVDDDVMVRQVLTKALTAAGIAVVAQASDGDEVVAAVQTHHPDLVLMDIRMERMDGIAATRAVRALPTPPAVLALTSFDTEAAIIDAIDAGAGGFLAKDASADEILAAIRHVARGEGWLSPRASRVMVERFQASGQDADRLHAQRMLAQLTGRERDVALAVARGLTNEEVAAALHLGLATVKTYLGQASAKLGVDNRVKLALVVAAAGEAPLTR